MRPFRQPAVPARVDRLKNVAGMPVAASAQAEIRDPIAWNRIMIPSSG
jgi:hypothetical protein